MGRASLNLLSKDELDRIHNSTLEILENPWLIIPSEGALEILERAGANVNREKNSVTIPPNIVKEALKKAQRRHYRLCSTIQKRKRLMNVVRIRKSVKRFCCNLH